MALRLRKDVQKASYYVWFLGAEEARGLRGPRVLLPAIPHLIERAREQEPLKVTLQVSHKGMKIVQGSSKHFITHSAITCSVQAEDIVACVLLLYNPTTKCPLHVHAYRCDSETTAQALHQFLQILINRPENQKRFAELEARLGLQTTSAISNRSATTITNTTSATIAAAAAAITATSSDNRKPLPSSQKRTTAAEPSPKRFESSLGSDTGTSTRESECSEELSPIGSATTVPPPPVSPLKASLYDSLAAELRAKLNGNGPPLLLPPRDYDTVHRSKGNLAATELRRCRNSLIVGGPGTVAGSGGGGGPTSAGGTGKQAVSSSRSRNSSGIGSDLAPSPEQQDGHCSSSDDEWVNNNHNHHHHHNHQQQQDKIIHSPIAKVLPHRRPPPPINRSFSQEKSFETFEESAQPPSYLYPREPSAQRVKTTKSANDSTNRVSSSTDGRRSEHRSAVSRGGDDRASSSRKYPSSKEEEIKPIIMRPKNFDFRFKDLIDGGDPEATEKYRDEEKFKVNSNHVQEKLKLERKYRPVNNNNNVESEEKRWNDERPMRDRDDYPSYRDNDNMKRSYDKELEQKRSEKENILLRENLTDRQKYKESLMEKQKHSHSSHKEHSREREYYLQEPPIPRESYEKFKPSAKNKSKYDNAQENSSSYQTEATMERINSRHNRHVERNVERTHSDKPYLDYDQSVDRNPYREPDSLPYRESIEKMLKSPIMKYKSFDSAGGSFNNSIGDEEPISFNQSFNSHKGRDGGRKVSREYGRPIEKYDHPEPVSRRRIIEKQRSHSRSPEVVMKVSPRDRFQDAKEKFQAMERDRHLLEASRQSRRHGSSGGGGCGNGVSGGEIIRRGSFEHPSQTMHHAQIDRSQIEWSSDEDQPTTTARIPTGRTPSASGSAGIVYRDRDGPQRYSGATESSAKIIAPAKSLGNLVRGYRHSYAEPRNPLPRNSGRVGLAAVNPF